MRFGNLGLVVGVGCVAAVVAQPAASQRRAGWQAELSGPVTTWLEEAAVPGLAVAIVEEGRLSWQGSFGVRKAGSPGPVTAETVFEAASLSKPVFAYAVMKLVDQGTIQLDTPLAQYLAKADLAQVFEFNTRQYPGSANVYDSLAEAQEKKGDRREAIRNYARALSMGDADPSSSAYQALKRLLNEKQ